MNTNLSKNNIFTLPVEPIVPSVKVPSASKISLNRAMKIAENYQAEGKLQEAEQVLRSILADAPKFSPALHLLGIVAHSAGNIKIAIELINAAISEDQNVALWHANLAEMYRLEKNLDLALIHGKKAIKIDPNFVSAHSNLGIIYYDQKKYDEAEKHHKIALKINSMCAPSLNNMGSILRKRDKYEEAAEYCRKAIRANPNFLDPQNNLGEIMTRLEKPNEAIEILDRVLAINPNYESAHCNRGMAMLALGNEQEATASYLQALRLDNEFIAAYAGLTMVALEFYRLEQGEKTGHKLVELAPEEADSHAMLGSILMAQGRTEEAEAAFAQGCELDSDHTASLCGRGHIYMERGNLKEAEGLFRQCSKNEGDISPAIYSLIQVKKVKEGDAEIALMEEESKKLDGNLINSKAIQLNYALGKMYDDIGQYDKGFPYYIEGARLKRGVFDYKMEDKERNFDEIKSVFTKKFISEKSGFGYESDVPIFVLGMPRSGTTLTEQIIASHPYVHGAGELRDITKLTEKMKLKHTDMSFVQAIQNIDPSEFTDLGLEYVENIQKLSPQSAHITDKMPGNFQYIGLIHLLLPKAKIVHVMRNPLDTCISCFTRLFAHGQASTYDLEEIGHAYKCYKSLMAHWREVLPEGTFYEIQYENIVDDTENEARKLIEYCGLEWDESCLEFYNNKRVIRTASLTQVREPIYKTSKERWKNYEQFLDPLIKGLGEAV